MVNPTHKTNVLLSLCMSQIVANVILPQNSNCAIITDCDCYKDPSCSKQLWFRSETAEAVECKGQINKASVKPGARGDVSAHSSHRIDDIAKRKERENGVKCKGQRPVNQD